MTQPRQDFSQVFYEHKYKYSIFVPKNLPFKAQEKAAKVKEGKAQWRHSL